MNYKNEAMKYSLRSLMIVALLAPPLMALVSCCGGMATDFYLDPMPWNDGPPPGFNAWKEGYVNMARLACPLAVAVAAVFLLIALALSPPQQG